MKTFASRMNGGRGGRGGRGAGGYPHQPNHHYHQRHGTATSGEDRGPAVETFNPMTSGFFADLDASGKLKHQVRQQEYAASQQALQASQGTVKAAPSQSNAEDAGLHDDEAFAAAASKGGNRDSRSGNQTQDSVLWIELGLCKALTRAVSHLGFLAPTPVQTQAIPCIMSGADCCVRAVTGSGKTAAFMLPMLHQLLTRAPSKQTVMSSRRRYIRAIVLVPSRELGVQCHEMTKQMLAFTTEVRTALAIGGVSAQAQEAALEQAPELVIATPGRFVDIIHNYKGPHGGVDLSGVEILCLDECDKMLTITLKDQVVSIVDKIPAETRQLLLFSATMTSEVDEFAKRYLFEPKNVDVGHVALASQLRQQFVRIKVDASVVAQHAKESSAGGDKEKRTAGRSKKHRDDDSDGDMDSASDDESSKKKKRVRSKRLREAETAEETAAEEKEKEEAEIFGPSVQEHVTKIKTRYLVVLCEQYFKTSVLIFTKYRTTAHRLQKVFHCLGLRSAELQGNQLQEERFEALRQFASGEVQYLFCTDVASRGLDIKGVATVINFDLPPTLTAYIHRVGRTARIGAVGTAASLVHETIDADIMRKILTVSGNINEHQVASVKRRDVPDELIAEATTRIDASFPQVREILAAERLAEKISLAEKLLNKERADPRASYSIADAITAKPKRQWCLSKKERKERDDAARKKYEQEAEVTIQEAQQELAELDREEAKFLQRQKAVRKQVREKKQRVRDNELAKLKEARKKQGQKIQAGNVKALKKKKIREARKVQRAENREKKGRPAFQHKDGKKRNKKSRHTKRPKKH